MMGGNRGATPPLQLKRDKGTGTGKRRPELRGRVIGDLTVGNRAPNPPGRQGQVYYHCTCVCGRQVLRSSTTLLTAANRCSPMMHKNDK